MLVYLMNSLGQSYTGGAAGQSLQLEILLTPADLSTADSTRTAIVTFVPADRPEAPTSTALQLRGGARCDGSPCFFGIFPFVTTVTGTLTVTSPGISPADTPTGYTRPVDVWVPQTRSGTDQPDTRTGFQLHPVYLVPADAVDQRRDTSGEIGAWLAQGARLLDREVGDHWQIDIRKDGSPDITYIAASQYTTAQLSSMLTSTAPQLLASYFPGLPAASDRKTYLFLIEIPGFRRPSTDPLVSVSTTACGYTSLVTRAVQVATGSTCAGYVDGLDWRAAVIVHETLHSFGVEHVSAPGDLMRASADNSTTLRIDAARALYVKSDTAGVDVSRLRVWSKQATNTALPWPCLYETNTRAWLCGTGMNTVDLTEVSSCWNTAGTPMRLQRYTAGRWVAVSTLAASRNSRCTQAGFSLSYRATMAATTPGQVKYRLVRGKWVSKPFTVVYQR